MKETSGQTTTILIEEARKKYGPSASPLKNFDLQVDAQATDVQSKCKVCGRAWCCSEVRSFLFRRSIKDL